MKLIAGYQLTQDDGYIDCLLEKKGAVGEVYFSWGGQPSARGLAGAAQGMTPWQVLDRQRYDLGRLAAGGMALNLLLNANCYGEAALDTALYRQTGDLVQYLIDQFGLGSVTTASPLMARFVKRNFPDLEVRASVNMEIGTVQGAEYLFDVMDGFYIKREMNRNLAAVQRLAQALHDRGKRVYLLANSGCLNHCCARTFHDNLVAHEAQLVARAGGYPFERVCGAFLNRAGNKGRLLALSKWVRPEDIPLYEGLVDGVKLATRVSAHPQMIVRAYAMGRFYGNMLDLTEPSFSQIYHPAILDNRALDGHLEQMKDCAGDCEACGLCARFQAAALKQTDLPTKGAIIC